jgi:hypothetical protein
MKGGQRAYILSPEKVRKGVKSVSIFLGPIIIASHDLTTSGAW